NQMFGPPAAGNRLSSEVEFTSYLFRSKTYKDYFFSDPERDYSSKTERLGDGNLDDNGEKTYNVIVPKSAKPPSMLVANVYSEVFDDGGRAVGAYASVPVHIYNYYLGVKLKEAGKIYKRGDRVELDIVAVNRADALQKIKDVEVIVKRKVYYSIFRRSVWDRDSYNTSAYEEVLIYRTIDIDGKASLAFDADVEGEYKVYIGNEQRMRTGIDINVTGPGFTTFDMTKADRVTMALDREKYMPGDTATLTMNVPFDGYVYLTLENSKVVYERYLPVANGSVTARIPVLESYMPNIYVNAIAVRKPSEKYLSMPFSAYGIANLEIDKTAKDLKPRIECTEEVMSNAGIKVSIGNLRPGTAAVLAAVDEGILQIIRFKTPDPLEFFYRKRSMDTTSYTMLNSLLTDITAKKQAVGGDSYAGMQKHLNPVQAKNVESFAKFSGLVYADDTGTINYTFDTEKFNGKARVMALCVKNDMFGAADKYVNVVDPIVITPTLPRFLALNDEFFLPVRIYNNTGADAEFDFEAALKGPVSIENSRQKIAIPSKGEVVVSLRCRAGNEAGAAKFYFKASGNGQEMSVERELAVRPAARPETKVYRGVLEPGKNFSVNIPANYIKYGKKAGVYLNYSRVGEYAAAFDYLINYPYGCVEQTVSAAFPLLYYKDLGLLQRIMEERGSNTDYFINEAIRKIKQFVMSDGRIEFWPGSGYIVPEWISLYTANFLIEARLHGYAVEDELYNRVLAAVKLSPKDRNMEVQQSRLDRRDENAEDQGYQEGDGRGEYAESGGGQDGTDVAERNTLSDSMYRFYLKTLLNTPDTEKMAYYEELYAIHLNRDRKQGELLKNLGYNAEKIKMMENSLQKTDMLKGGLLYKYANEFAGRLSETDRFLLSMGYSQYNNREAAKMVIYDDFKTKFMARELGGMFNSPARNLGMYLKAISQAEGKPSARIDLNEDALLRMLRDDGSFGSTQETAWALMGLASADRAKAESGVINAGISVNGAAYSKQAGVTGVTMKDSKGLWKDISVENEGKNRFYYNVYVEGVPAEKNKATVSKGMKVYRKYFNEDGSEANLTSVKQGRLVIVSVTVEALSGRTLDNVVIVDMLPAGFEIENPRLKTRGRLSFTPEANFNAAFEDIRDDRMILFTKQFSGSQTFSYSVRAVTPGRFTVPNVYAEAMYDPELVAETYEDKYLVVAPALASGR
ncbi:MAG: hypothetical protein LLG37_03880, partial [Spirochaetia bacterium]|nr:hypothetical protein [Spirochaetia bacterium]